MRRSGWMLIIIAGLTWITTVIWPAVAAAVRITKLPRTDVEMRSAGTLLLTSFGWAAMIAATAVLVGWAPGRLLGKQLAQRGNQKFVPLAALLLVPICLPAYVIFYAWWQSWPSESSIYHWVVEHQYMHAARLLTLFLGMACWSWPLVSWCVAGTVAGTPAQREELLMLDGAGPLRRFADMVRRDARGLAIGALLVFFATFSNTTCFDLSEIFTFTNELRATAALGANAKDVLVTGLPAVGIAGCGAMMVWWLLSSKPREAAAQVRPAAASTVVITVAAWALSVLLPVILFALHIFSSDDGQATLREFFTLYRWSVANTLTWAAISGTIAAGIAVGLCAAWQDHRRWVRTIASTMALGWLALGISPGTLIGVGLQAGFNQPPFIKWVYSTPAILIIAHLTCFGFVAALMARWMALREPATITDLRKLDDAYTLRGIVDSTWPRLLATAFATFAVMFVLAIGEIPVTAVVNPPQRAGAGPLALTILNDMHYQRPQTVMVATLGMVIIAMIVAIVANIAWRFGSLAFRSSKRLATFAVSIAAIAITLCLSGCEPDDPGEARPLASLLTFGVAGTGMGQFSYPRAIDVDPTNKFVYVIDKEARVQRFGFDGVPQLQWRMPEKQNGKPTGVTVAPDGRVFVPDTHYFRVIAYDSDGHELLRFGGYGREPGHFIYPTDVAIGPEGRIYVSEYGGNDRIQVFDPEGNYLFQFGTFGREFGEFNRPQSMVFNPAKTELFITDACNHRIVVTDPQGRWLRTFGAAGRGFGELTYPYGIMMLPDGTLLVAEYGNNRVQRFDQIGKPLGVFGTIGRGPGELQYPWGVAGTDDKVFVLDSGNNRVQMIRTP